MAILATAPGPTETVIPTENQSVNQFFGQADITQLLQIANSYAPVLNQAISFIANPSNLTPVSNALEILGMPTYYPGNVFRDHQGWCAAYGSLNDFYFLALMFFKYPKPANNGSSCQILKGYITALDQEKIYYDQKYAADGEPCAHSSGIKAINVIQGIYRGMYSTMSCDVLIQQQIDDKKAADAKALQDHAAQLQIEAQQKQAAIAAAAAQNAANLQLKANAQNASNTANIAGTGTKGTNSYMVYGIIGAAVLLGFMAYKIFTKKSTQ